MSSANFKTISSVETLGITKLRRIFSLTSMLADLAEDILEERGDYKPSFRQGLQKSIIQAQAGKVKKLHSLRDLI